MSELRFGDENELAKAIRKAIGASDFEAVQEISSVWMQGANSSEKDLFRPDCSPPLPCIGMDGILNH